MMRIFTSSRQICLTLSSNRDLSRCAAPCMVLPPECYFSLLAYDSILSKFDCWAKTCTGHAEGLGIEIS
eukprot:scaffold30752_cov44-Skeletonema_dohrnii-CCMP3373.AAC.1